MINILVLQDLTSRIHLLIISGSSLGFYLFLIFVEFSHKFYKSVIPRWLGEIFKFFFRLLENVFASHKIDPKRFYLCPSSVCPRFLSSPPGLRKPLILHQIGFFQNIPPPLSSADKALGGPDLYKSKETLEILNNFKF